MFVWFEECFMRFHINPREVNTELKCNQKAGPENTATDVCRVRVKQISQIARKANFLAVLFPAKPSPPRGDPRHAHREA